MIYRNSYLEMSSPIFGNSGIKIFCGKKGFITQVKRKLIERKDFQKRKRIKNEIDKKRELSY